MANILIVEDNIVMRRLMKSLLLKKGHNIVAEATNGQEGFELYTEHQPDVVLLDITMPEVDGLQALKNIMRYDPTAKVIMVTALEEKDKIFEAIGLGAKQYVVKPINPDIIYEKIDKVLSL